MTQPGCESFITARNLHVPLDFEYMADEPRVVWMVWTKRKDEKGVNIHCAYRYRSEAIEKALHIFENYGGDKTTLNNNEPFDELQIFHVKNMYVAVEGWQIK